MEQKLAARQLELRVQLDEKSRLERTLHVLEKKLAEHEKRQADLEQTLSKEQLDLHRMDRFSLVNVVRKWRGTHEELREKEFEEAALAELKLNEHEAMVHDLRKDSKELQSKLRELRDAETNWQDFLQQKEAWVKQADREASKQFDEKLQRVSEFQSLLKEIDEALYAGRAADRSLEKALKKVKEAYGMSTWDTFLGGGLIVTMMKHDDLDKSESALHEAQLNLERFEAELSDVQNGAIDELIVERGSFVTFADYFFDDIFSEWSIHNRINDSLSKVENTKLKLARVLGNLQLQRGQIEQGLENAKSAYEEAVEVY